MTQFYTPAKSSRKRDAILAAAETCFLDDGFAATSMDEVAAKALVSKATIYAHFDSKAHLFAAVIRHGCDTSLFCQGTWTVENGDARATLMRIATEIMTLLMSSRVQRLHRVVVAESYHHPEMAEAFWEVGPGYTWPRFAGVVEELNRLGLLAVPDPLMATNLLVGMLKSEVFFRSLLGLPNADTLSSADATVKAAVEMLLAAYATK